MAVDSVACADCPLRAVAIFKQLPASEVALIQSLRHAQMHRPAGAILIEEGSNYPSLYTLFGGWAFRYMSLSDGRRQILNFLLPGDFIGLQQNIAGGASHGVEALTDVWLCPFPKDTLWELHRQAPELGYDITWLAAQEEGVVDNNLLSVGRRNAKERLATLLVILFKRAAALLPTAKRTEVPFPLTQVHIADALGLSLAHTHRTLRALEQLGLHRIRDGWLSLPNPLAIARVADIWGDGVPEQRPLI